jgi:hypothetical protein
MNVIDRHVQRLTNVPGDVPWVKRSQGDKVWCAALQQLDVVARR